MATPTPMKQALSQQGRTPVATVATGGTPAGATPPVSTPYAPAVFSPLGPRSSPQTTFKRSPAHYTATMMSHSASNGGHGPSGGGGGGGYDSPAAAAMGAMGLDLVVEDASFLGVSAAAAAAVAARNDEDERARRLQAVQALLRQHAGKGRVSEAGLERLATSMGLECLWEEGMGAGAGSGSGSGGGANSERTLIIAGSALALEIAVANNLVTAVTVTFPEARRIALRRVARANAVLLGNLRLGAHESPLTKTLDAFAANLEQLAVLDRLSVQGGEGGEGGGEAKADGGSDATTGLNLYEAVAGLYVSLQKLYRWDRRQVAAAEGREEKEGDDEDEDDNDDLSDDIALRVQCTRHGRPALNEAGRLGLAIAYWTQRRLVPPARPRTRAFAAARETTWRLRIGCAPMGDGLVYQPVRVSDQWIGDAILHIGDSSSFDADGQPVLDWRNPENTLVSAGEGEGQGQGQGQLPAVKFVATFDPPLTVPYSAWHQIYDMVGLVPETDGLVTFDSLSFPGAGATGQHDPSDPRTIRCYKDVPVPRTEEDAGGGGGSVRHRHTLFIYKPVFGRVMTELPFAHPSQLVRMLPILRQYAFLATLLEKSFRAEESPSALSAPSAPSAQPAKKTKPTVRTTTTVDGAFDVFRGSAMGTASMDMDVDMDVDTHVDDNNTPPATSVDVVLTVHPVPRLQVVFPFRGGTADILLEIGLNGQVHVVLQNVLDADGEDDTTEAPVVPDHKGKGKGLGPQDLGRMLEVCEDLGIWSEWIRRRCA